jgi:hypothetical protein
MRRLQPEFLDALFGEDDLGVVVRTHIYIESGVNSILEQLIPFPEELPRLRYEQKLKLCCAMGLDKSLLSPLKELGNLRNSFGHDINTRLSTASVSKLLSAVSTDDLDTIIKSYTSTLADTGEALPVSFHDLDPKSQLIGFAIWLNATLDVIRKDAKNKNGV